MSFVHEEWTGIFQFFAVAGEPVNFTQVPHEELKGLGTGMITAG